VITLTLSSKTVFILSLTNEIITKITEDGLNGYQGTEIRKNLVRTVMYNMERFEDLNSIINSFHEVLTKTSDSKHQDEIKTILSEIVYKEGLMLKDLNSYNNIRKKLNKKLQELGMYTDNTTAAKFDRLSVQLKNQLRRLSQYDRKKLVNEIEDLSEKIITRYSPEKTKSEDTTTQPETKTSETTSVLNKQLINLIDQKINTIESNVTETIKTELQGLSNTSGQLTELGKKIDMLLENQAKLKEKVDTLSKQMSQREKTVKKIRNDLKSVSKQTDEFSKTSEALDKMDEIPDTELVVESEKGEDDQEQDLDEEDFKNSLTDSIKKFMDE